MKHNMKRFFFIFLMCFTALTMQAQSNQYVDLGLPSGTSWKSTNESGFYDYDSASRIFGDKLPTKNQWEELMTFCIWTWTGKGYKITGKNRLQTTILKKGRGFLNLLHVVWVWT